MGKGKSPTPDELRFVYELFARGCHDTDVLKEYEQLNKHGKLGFMPYRQDIRFVRLRRKEFEAAQGILEAKFKAKSVPTWVQKHWNDLAEIAKQLDDMWIQHMESGRGIENGDYIVNADSASFEGFVLRYGHQAAQLLSHLRAEFPKEFKGIYRWTDLLKSPLPKGCLHWLVLVSKRRTFFEGTCEICQGWQ